MQAYIHTNIHTYIHTDRQTYIQHLYIHTYIHAYMHGRRLRGTGGTVPQKFELGTARASVPPIFREVVLSDACESTN